MVAKFECRLTQVDPREPAVRPDHDPWPREPHKALRMRLVRRVGTQQHWIAIAVHCSVEPIEVIFK